MQTEKKYEQLKVSTMPSTIWFYENYKKKIIKTLRNLSCNYVEKLCPKKPLFNYFRKYRLTHLGHYLLVSMIAAADQYDGQTGWDTRQ